MAISVTQQKLVDGSRVAVVKYYVVSDAASDVSNQHLQVMQDLVPVPKKNLGIVTLKATSSDMDIDLHWDGSPDRDSITLPAGQPVDLDFRKVGGLINPVDWEAPGYTGDLLFSTRGAAADSEAFILIEYKKR